MEKPELKDFATKAYNILHNNKTIYSRSKEIISSLFQNDKEYNLDLVIFRLTLIDSYYSTQINSKRLFGIDELADEIVRISNGSDAVLINKCEEFLKAPYSTNDIKDLFQHQKYGIHKTGEPAGQAPSLISKYLYFLMKYKFPIYNNLAIDSYNKIKSKYEFDIQKLKKEFDISYFDNLKQLNICSGINNYEKLDNLLWLLGKITQGSLSIIIDMNTYVELTQKANVNTKIANIKAKNSKEKDKRKKDKRNVDDLIREYISNDINNLNEIFKDKDLIKFFEYSLQLKNQKKQES